MTTQLPQNHTYIANLLPAFVNHTLDLENTKLVQQHLFSCESCQRELSAWETIKNAAQRITAAAPEPSITILDQVWAKIEAPQALKHQWALPSTIFHLWLVFKKQIPIIHKSIWIGMPLVILFGCVLALIATLLSRNLMHDAVSILVLVTTVASASSVAFIYGVENDAALEITLSTPTSMRVVMLSRLILVGGYNTIISMLATAIIALAQRGGFWETMQLWLGPMLFLSSMTLALSLVIGSWFAVLVAFVLESLQALPLYFERHIPILQLASPASWQTNPTILLLALLFILFAIFYVPRQPRLSS